MAGINQSECAQNIFKFIFVFLNFMPYCEQQKPLPIAPTNGRSEIEKNNKRIKQNVYTKEAEESVKWCREYQREILLWTKITREVFLLWWWLSVVMIIVMVWWWWWWWWCHSPTEMTDKRALCLNFGDVSLYKYHIHHLFMSNSFVNMSLCMINFWWRNVAYQNLFINDFCVKRILCFKCIFKGWQYCSFLFV